MSGSLRLGSGQVQSCRIPMSDAKTGEEKGWKGVGYYRRYHPTNNVPRPGQRSFVKATI